MKNKVYPFRLYEKVLAVLILVLAIGGTAMAPLSVSRPESDGKWKVCIEIGFIPSWYHCWEFGGPKQLTPDVPAGCCSDTCVGPCQ